MSLSHRPFAKLAEVRQLFPPARTAPPPKLVITWAEMSQAVYDDDRLVPETTNVVDVRPRRRSTSREIAQVRQQEERRGRR